MAEESLRAMRYWISADVCFMRGPLLLWGRSSLGRWTSQRSDADVTTILGGQGVKKSAVSTPSALRKLIFHNAFLGFRFPFSVLRFAYMFHAPIRFVA